MKRTLVVEGETHELEICRRRGSTVMTWDGEEIPLDICRVERSSYSVILEGRSVGVNVDRIRNADPDLHGFRATAFDGAYEFTLQDPRKQLLAEAMAPSKNRACSLIHALMPGRVLKLFVTPGETVEEGQPLLILEAMKMQNEYVAPAAAKVVTLHVEEGTNLEIGAPMITLHALEEEGACEGSAKG